LPHETGVSRVLIVDDHRNTRESLAIGFAVSGWQADTAGSADEALRLLHAGPYDCVITDVRMPGKSGIELVRLARDRFPHLAVVLMTAYALTPEETAVAAAAGALSFIKPVTAEMLSGVLAAHRPRAVVPPASTASPTRS
jgi:DNA-binding NtrC family response regulator